MAPVGPTHAATDHRDRAGRSPFGRLRGRGRNAGNGECALGQQHRHHQRGDRLAELVRGRGPRRAAGTVAGSAADTESDEAIRGGGARRRGRGQGGRGVGSVARSAAIGRPARPSDAFGETRRQTPISASSDGCSTSLSAAFDAARGADRILYGFARHEVATTYLGPVDRAAAALGTADRRGRVEREVRGPAAVGVGRRLHGRLRRRRPAGHERELGREARAGPPVTSTFRPAGTTRCCRRPRWPTS